MPKDYTKAAEVLTVAQELYRRNPDWVTFFREVLGLNGIVRMTFFKADELAAFEQTPEYQQIQKMLAELRERSGDLESQERMAVITVRLPVSIHQSLKREAEERGTSLNKLAVSKLMQGIDGDLVPKVQVPKEDSSVAAAD